jgi:lantibiotic modifying enzyme
VFTIYALRKGVDIDCTNQLYKAINYIKNNELKNGPVLFPVIVNQQNTKGLYPYNICYGDLGTAYSLMQAALFLNDDSLKEYAYNVFSRLLAIEYKDPYLIAGTGLLYGHAGIALTYYRLFELTGNKMFSDAYKSKIDEIAGKFHSGDEFLGYEGYFNQELPVINYTFFEGLIGIGAILMASQKPLQHHYIYEFFYL